MFHWNQMMNQDERDHVFQWNLTMNQEDIHRLIKQGEGITIEFKENFGKEAIETAGALANTQGGHILIGVNKKGAIKGVTLFNEIID